jgi:hypothetical protein
MNHQRQLEEAVALLDAHGGEAKVLRVAKAWFP